MNLGTLPKIFLLPLPRGHCIYTIILHIIFKGNESAAEITEEIGNIFGRKNVIFLDAKAPYEQREENMKLLPTKKIVIGTDSSARGVRISHAKVCFVYDALISGSSKTAVKKKPDEVSLMSKSIISS